MEISIFSPTYAPCLLSSVPFRAYWIFVPLCFGVRLNRCVNGVRFLYQSCIPNMAGVREGPAGGIKHHHLPPTHGHPQLTWNTHTRSIYQSFLNTLSQTCGPQLPVFTLLGGQEKHFQAILLLPDSTQASTYGRFLPMYVLLLKSTLVGEKKESDLLYFTGGETGRDRDERENWGVSWM